MTARHREKREEVEGGEGESGGERGQIKERTWEHPSVGGGFIMVYFLEDIRSTGRQQPDEQLGITSTSIVAQHGKGSTTMALQYGVWNMNYGEWTMENGVME